MSVFMPSVTKAQFSTLFFFFTFTRVRLSGCMLESDFEQTWNLQLVKWAKANGIICCSAWKCGTTTGDNGNMKKNFALATSYRTQ